MSPVLGSAAVTMRRVGHAALAAWRSIRNPTGWYDEVNEVYGREGGPTGAQRAGSAAVGGVMGGGGPL